MKMIDLYGIAKKNLDSGKYLSLKDAIAKYPEGITINGVSSRVGKDKKEYYTLTFTENHEKFIPASSGDLKKMVSLWLEKGNIDEVNEALSVNNLKIKIEKITQKNGNPYVKVYVVGTVPAEPTTFTDEEGNTIDADTGEVYGDAVPF